MKKEKKLKKYDGMLEDMLRTVPDITLLKLFREEENGDLRRKMQFLVRKMPGLDDFDFAEELYYLMKKEKQRINETEDPKQKIKLLQDFIAYVKNNYDLDAYKKTFSKD